MTIKHKTTTVKDRGPAWVKKFNNDIQGGSIDVQELLIATAMQDLCCDMADSQACKVENLLQKTGKYKLKNKQTIKQIKNLTASLVADITRDIPSEQRQIEFGMDSDFFLECVLLLNKIHPDDRMIAISTLNLFVKP